MVVVVVLLTLYLLLLTLDKADCSAYNVRILTTHRPTIDRSRILPRMYCMYFELSSTTGELKQHTTTPNS